MQGVASCMRAAGNLVSVVRVHVHGPADTPELRAVSPRV